nr:FAD-dependent oxidoreductase [Streptomyces pactum]
MLACGVRPRVELAADAGIVTARGVVVDDELRTSDPDVFAVGDCAEHAGVVHGFAGPAQDQADLLALVIGARAAARPGSSGAAPAGDRRPPRYTGSRPSSGSPSRRPPHPPPHPRRPPGPAAPPHPRRPVGPGRTATPAPPGGPGDTAAPRTTRWARRHRRPLHRPRTVPRSPHAPGRPIAPIPRLPRRPPPRAPRRPERPGRPGGPARPGGLRRADARARGRRRPALRRHPRRVPQGRGPR